MEFTTTARGAPALVFNGFKYVVNRKMPVENLDRTIICADQLKIFGHI